jgi:2-isopropylmalate synthase
MKYSHPKPITISGRKWPSKIIETSPIWCSVCLRDGNQSLPNPMNPKQKLEYFQLLCKIGFKEIEIGFPSASQDDFDFVRLLIEKNFIPDDVTISVLTQCRSELINKTLESLQGVKQAIVHTYIATSQLHVEKVFGFTQDQTINIAINSTLQISDLASKMTNSNIRFEFSLEEFTDTNLDFSVKICSAIYEAWNKSAMKDKMIFNLPATVERRPPNQYADMIEYFCDNFKQRENVIISVHAHNDQGMAVAATELAILAGADRIEGTLFGHGERTGNVDLVTFSLNLFSRGINTGLNFSNLPETVSTVVNLTSMPVSPRHPYAGELVFTAFSGGHQDAIKKTMVASNADEKWSVSYLHIDPQDLGCGYERLIRINSQSGKGGASWVLEKEFGIYIPKPMQAEFGRIVQKFTEEAGREISSDELYKCFTSEFVNPEPKIINLISYRPYPMDNSSDINGKLKIVKDEKEYSIKAQGNGPIDAFVKGLLKLGLNNFTVGKEHSGQSCGSGSDAQAIIFTPLDFGGGIISWGVGIDTNSDQAAVKSIMAAINRRK